MMPKRSFSGVSESGTTEQTSPRDPKRLKSASRDVRTMLSVQDMATRIEPFVRTVVRDEVEQAFSRALNPSLRSSFYQNDTSLGGRGFLLRFVNKPPSTIFTGSRIEAEDGSTIRIELLNANTKTLVTSSPLSSLKIDILALDGDFGPDDQENWSENHFNANIVREREGKRPLLTGDLNVTLKDGVALITDVTFTDNSSWQRSGKFRLGARPASRTCLQTRIREARSEAFMVKDRRGELYKKHYPPQLDDEVWRLEKIGKDGPTRKKLTELGIHTVRDFLQFYAVNPTELRRILGVGMSNRMWDTIIDHANTCVLDDKFYAYFEAGQNVGLLFNCVYKLIGTFDGEAFESLEKLTPPQKALVENLKRQAYKNVNCFVPIDARANLGPSKPLLCSQIDLFPSQNLASQPFEFSLVRSADQPEMTIDFNTAESADELQVSLAENIDQTYLLQSTLKNSFKLSDIFLPSTVETSTTLPPVTSGSQWPLVTSSSSTTTATTTTANQLLTHEHNSLLAQTPNTWCATPSSSKWEYGKSGTFVFSSGSEDDGMGFMSSNGRFSVHMSGIGKPKAGWSKLRAIIMWASVRRGIAAKRMWQSLCHVDY